MSCDQSRIDRRTAVKMTLSLLGAGTIRGADPPLHFTALDHVEFFVADIQRSVAFYARIFGNTVMKNKQTTRRYVKLGGAYIAMDGGQQIRVDHFCAGIPGFQVAGMHSYLEQRGIAYRDYPSGRDLSVADPDGTRLQLASDNGWDLLAGGTASPESIPSNGEAIFRPIGLDHILVNVSDPEKAAGFYEKILGPVTQRNNNRTWFQTGTGRIGLLQTPNGARAGVNHFCVSAAAFDYDAVVKKLEQAGVKLETPEVAGAPDFRDPDGYRIQVMAPRAA
jgi:catechol 2,3-dioxygenase-like lactoylglutathione lyase family enzyme